jgi:hypothetical protein
MRRSKPQPIRNKLDLADRKQVRLVKRRLRISEVELTTIVGKIGNSLAAISKEVAIRRGSCVPEPAQSPPAAAIVAVQAAETITSDVSGVAETS